jgi:hypothetical protein
MENNTYEYVTPELKSIPMTDEYAAHYWHQQGWMACRLAYKAYDDAEKAGAFRV